MADLTKDQVLAALPGLTKPDLKAIQAVIAGLLGEPSLGPATAPNEPIAWLYDAITLHLGARQNYQTFLQTAPGKQFSKNAPVAISFIASNFQGVLDNRVKAQALMRYLGSLLFADLKAQKVPITRRTVMANIHRLGDVFNNAFPDYTKAGIGMMVMKTLLKRELKT